MLAGFLDQAQRPEVDGGGDERGEVGQVDAVGVGHAGLDVQGEARVGIADPGKRRGL